MCGPAEAGKDAVFVNVDPLGITEIYVVQTKKGKLNESRTKERNVVEAATQLKTALATTVMFVSNKSKLIPSKVYLCCSGTINDAAKRHIIDEVRDPRIFFLDVDDLIPKIDHYCPEIWLSLEAELMPYFRSVVQAADAASRIAQGTDPVAGDSLLAAVSDSSFVQLRLNRWITKARKRNNVIEQEPHWEELPATALPSRRERAILVLAEAGAGKSTCLRRIAYIVAKKGLEAGGEYRVPVVLRASDLAKRSSTPLIEAAADETKRLANSNTSAFGNADLSKGKVLLLIDGLDEVSDQEGRKRLLEMVSEVHASYPLTQVILTSRNYKFVQEMPQLAKYAQFRLSPINIKQAAEILDRATSLSRITPANAKELLRRLEQVHGMELNPLLVTVFAATGDYARRDIPANITELFKKYTEMMLGRWDQSKGIGQQFHAPLKDFVLRRVAYEMHRRRVTSIDVKEFEELMTNELLKRGHRTDAAELLAEMIDRSGLFRITGNSIEFNHMLLQEFFAGRGIPSDDSLDALIGDEWWQRPVVFYFGENPDNATGLVKLGGALGTRPPNEVFPAAVTLGLSLQACYLVEVPNKVSTFLSVVRGLSCSLQQVTKANEHKYKYPLMQFVNYYLLGRDAVACDLTHHNFDELFSNLDDPSISAEERELRTFWLIVGLIEAGHLERVEKLLKKFRPADGRLLLSLFAGCFFTQHMRMVEPLQSRLAARCGAYLAAQIPHLRTQLLEEMKAELFDIRSGKLTIFETPSAQAIEDSDP